MPNYTLTKFTRLSETNLKGFKREGRRGRSAINEQSSAEVPASETSFENSFEIFFCRLFHCKAVVLQYSVYDTGQRSEMLVRSFFMHHQSFEGTCHFCDDMRGNIERAAVDRVEDLILAESVHITAIVIFLSDTFELHICNL